MNHKKKQKQKQKNIHDEHLYMLNEVFVMCSTRITRLTNTLKYPLNTKIPFRVSPFFELNMQLSVI